jgi:hypothetical protein
MRLKLQYLMLVVKEFRLLKQFKMSKYKEEFKHAVKQMKKI